MDKQSEFFLIKVSSGYEEPDELTATAALLHVTSELKAIIMDAQAAVIDLRTRHMEVWDVEVKDGNTLFLATGDADRLTGHSDDEGENDFLGERVFSGSTGIVSIDGTLYARGVAIWRENGVQMYTVNMHVSDNCVWWTTIYENCDLQARTADIRIVDLL